MSNLPANLTPDQLQVIGRAHVMMASLGNRLDGRPVIEHPDILEEIARELRQLYAEAQAAGINLT